MKCHQCEKQAMWLVGPNENSQVPLCLDCNYKIKQMESTHLKALMQVAQYAETQMETILGLPPSIKTTHLTQNGNIPLNNINIFNSNIGMVNTGKIHAESIDLAISSLKSNNQPDVANALQKLTEAILQSRQLDNSNRERLLEMLSHIAEESEKPPIYRKKHLIFDIFEKITQCVSLVESINTIWEQSRDILQNFFT